MMELSEISVGDESVLHNDAEGEPVVVGKVGTRGSPSDQWGANGVAGTTSAMPASKTVRTRCWSR
jgi:hypothetical protein